MRGELQFRLEIPSETRAERQHDGKTTHEPLPAVVVVLALVVTYLVARGASGMKIMPGTHLYFGAQTIGSAGHVVPIRLTTRDGSVLGISDVALMGSGFDVDAKACTSGRDSDQCMISVRFHPLVQGSQKAVLTINRKGSSGPQQVRLSGVGIPQPPMAPNVVRPFSPPPMVAMVSKVTKPVSPPPVTPNVTVPVSRPAVGPNVTEPISPPPVGPNVVGPVSRPPVGPVVVGPVSRPPLPGNWRPDYALVASPAEITIAQGNRGTSTIMVRRQQGFRGEVQLSVTGAPEGVKTSFTPARTADASMLTLYVPPAPAPSAEFAPLVNPGQYQLLITGTSGGLMHSTRVELTVNPGARPDYALLASPADITVAQGNRGTSTITVRRQQGFRGEVQLSVTGAPEGVKTSFTPARTADSSTLTLYIPPAPAPSAEFAPLVNPGQYQLLITGASGSLMRSTRVELTVNPGARPDYALLASPPEITVAQGNRGTSTIIVRRQQGFQGEVQLSVAGAPEGVKTSFTPARTADTSMLTVYVPPAPAPSTEFAPLVNPGQYRLLITGTSGSLMHETDVNLRVTPRSALPSRGMTHVEVKRNVILAPPSVPAGVSAASDKQMRARSGTDYRTASRSRPAADASQEKSRKDKQVPTKSLRPKLPPPPQ